jgi:hypothetical protein
MWAVPAQPHTGLTPMIPTPNVDLGIADLETEHLVDQHFFDHSQSPFPTAIYLQLQLH